MIRLRASHRHSIRFWGRVFLALFSLATVSEARVTKIQFTKTPFAGGAAFGTTGAYEVVQGTVFFVVDSNDARDAVIFDIRNAPVDAQGKVEFSADFYILKPVDLTKGNGDLFFEVNNRGGKIAFSLFNDAPSSANTDNPQTVQDVGNGFLLNQGYTLAWVGWEADVLPGNNLLTVNFPVATQGGQPIVERILVEIFDQNGVLSVPLSNSSAIASYPAVSTDQTVAGAELRMRPSDSPRPSAPDIPAGTVIPNNQWSFADCSGGLPGTPSTTHICLFNGFQANQVYQLIYKATNPPVSGLGYATTRDFVSFLRYATADDFGNPNPVAGLARFLGQGSSQSGRYLRDFIYQGFNEDEQGRSVFDGINIHVAGAHKMPLNYRFAQTDPYPLQHRDRAMPAANFPRAYGVRQNPLNGNSDGILKRPTSDPKVIHTVSSTEYWEYRASLVDTNESGTTDLTQPANVREFLLSGTPHLASVGDVPTLGACQQLSNPTTNGAVARALLVALEQWVRNGTQPADSRVPRISDGTLVPSDQTSTQFPRIPGVTYNGVYNASGEYDFGPRVIGNSGVVDNLPPTVLSTQTVLVPKVDAVGNDFAGVRQPLVEAPISTLTGWNLRDATFTDGDLCDLRGMTIPLANTLSDRLGSGDPRPSLQELYGDHATYVNKITVAAQSLQAQGLLLQQDVDQFIQDANNSNVLVPAPPPILVSITPAQASVTGGGPVVETANLSTQAPAGGAVVTLSTDNGSLLGVPASVTVAAGARSATFTVKTTPVSFATTATIFGSYGGGDQNATITVHPPFVTTTLLTSSANPSTVAQSVTFTATVTSASATMPTGTVTFFEGATQLGTSTLSAQAKATFATSSLSQGSHSLTAQYSGDANFSSSTSPILAQTVNADPDFSVTASPTSVDVTASQPGVVTFTVTPLNGSTQTVVFSCGNVPSSMTCAFKPQSLVLNGKDKATSNATIQLLSNAVFVPPVRLRPGLLRAVPLCMSLGAMLALCSWCLVARRPRRGLVGILALVFVAFGLIGCGGASPGSGGGQTVTINLTASAGGTSHSASVTVMVR